VVIESWSFEGCPRESLDGQFLVFQLLVVAVVLAAVAAGLSVRAVDP